MDKFKYTPIKDLFANKVCSKPTFYKYLRLGLFPIYKFGRRSYVIISEFEEAFTKVSFDNN